jgi:hypothetical protein
MTTELSQRRVTRQLLKYQTDFKQTCLELSLLNTPEFNGKCGKELKRKIEHLHTLLKPTKKVQKLPHKNAKARKNLLPFFITEAHTENEPANSKMSLGICKQIPSSNS